jgi:hypothetical protein
MKKIGIILNGVTGRMGTNQHLVRSILAIRDQGGVLLPDGSPSSQIPSSQDATTPNSPISRKNMVSSVSPPISMPPWLIPTTKFSSMPLAPLTASLSSSAPSLLVSTFTAKNPPPPNTPKHCASPKSLKKPVSKTEQSKTSYGSPAFANSSYSKNKDSSGRFSPFAASSDTGFSLESTKASPSSALHGTTAPKTAAA